MLTRDFYFDLPQELIAQHPSGRRGEDRLMLLDRQTGEICHHAMADLPDLIAPGTLMVFNNSRVRRARVYGIKETTGREQEFMFLNRLDQNGALWNVMVKNAKKQKPGMRYQFPDGTAARIKAVPENEGTEFRTLEFDRPVTEEWFEKNGHIPLPPYIRRGDTEEDSERYQNVYATDTGSAACPTAGLHFTEEMLGRLSGRGIGLEWLTLHVGLGTFLPVREEHIEFHTMHEEAFTVPEAVARNINAAKREGRPILAVGTTSVRTLESACDEDGTVRAGTSSTRIFMYPGYRFKVVDQLFTNFHTPESTLIMLVSAFAGRERILNAYKAAVEQRYRFFSYGDAMFIR
ncbi:MAG: tRNA preQ1(34) S-adenosylmethionine ribosyltransferase-isomerase QueA [Treponemataceae bacterium]|nr:tRNA preQ1(34) S-adenosylmethionine ribosyltransferase-isomerase QueA [Treponemataceae bacterium]